MYLFKIINKSKVRMNAPTKVHLRSSSKEKLDAIALVEEKASKESLPVAVCNGDVYKSERKIK